MLLESQPKKVGCLFRPRFTNVFWEGMEGNAVPFSIMLFSELVMC